MLQASPLQKEKPWATLAQLSLVHRALLPQRKMHLKP
jgi:hypothetical protein